jgi:hypothetical protein
MPNSVELSAAVHEANALVLESRRLRRSSSAVSEATWRALADRRTALARLIGRLETAGHGDNRAVDGAREAVSLVDETLAEADRPGL